MLPIEQLLSPTQCTLHAKPGGHVMGPMLHEPMPTQLMLQTPWLQPPLHWAGQAPPGGVGAVPHVAPPEPPAPVVLLEPTPTGLPVAALAVLPVVAPPVPALVVLPVAA